MQRKTKGKKRWVWVTAGIAITLIAAFLLINSIIAPVIGRKIVAAVRQAGEGGYTVQFNEIDVNIFTGKLVLSAVKPEADSGGLKQKPYRVSGSAAKIEITGIKVLNYWWHRKLEIGTLTIKGAVVELDKQINETSRAKPSETLYQKLSGSLKLVSAGHILLDNVRLKYTEVNDQPAQLNLQRVSFEARDLLIDSATQADTSRTLYCREIVSSIRNFNGFAYNGAYHYMLKNAHYSTLTKRLEAKGLAIKPLDVKRFFAKMDADRFDFELDTLSVEQFNYKNFLNKKDFHAAKISAAQGKLNIFDDPTGRTTPGDRVGSFPNFVLRKVQTRLLADTVDLAGISVSYSELNPQNGKTGTVEFAGTRTRLVHITNRPELLARNPWCSVKLATHLMGAGEIDLVAQFNQADKAGSYSIKGTLGQMPAAAINPVAMPLGLARIKSGSIRRLDFEIRGNRFKNTGDLGLLYRDVDLEMLTSNYHHKVLKTLLANTLVIARNNPDDADGTPRAARLDYNRPVNTPFFCALWQTLSDGIKACVEEKKSVTAVPTLHKSLIKKILTAPARLFKKKPKEITH